VNFAQPQVHQADTERTVAEAVSGFASASKIGTVGGSAIARCDRLLRQQA
jgi:hypothetical protein